LLGITRSTYYYKPCGENPWHLTIMQIMDKIYTAHPDKGKRRISEDLKVAGYSVGVDLCRTLMKKMGIEAVYPKPNLSKPNLEHKVYPYLLRGKQITHRNHVWSTDITYIPMANGFLYLTAVIDWFSRYVLSWKISNSLDGRFCREALLEALQKGTPEIFNTDQGSQYTSVEFTQILLDNKIAISMDGKGRALDNIFVERLWRTVKYEDVYLKDYQDGQGLHEGMRDYFSYYNTERLHSALGYKVPREVYFG
jgi:putative transposase